MSNPPTSKEQARRRMKAALAALTPAHIAAASAAVCDRLRALDIYARARTALLYAPIAAGPACEVDITALALDAIRTGKVVCVPHPDWATAAMSPVRITDWASDLVTDNRRASIGLRRPRDGATSVEEAEIDLMLVPGLGFDLAGGRLGRGGGFYDRFLARVRAVPRPGKASAPIIGVAFDEQVLPPDESLALDPWDVPMDALVTPSRFIRCARGRG